MVRRVHEHQNNGRASVIRIYVLSSKSSHFVEIMLEQIMLLTSLLTYRVCPHH